MNTFERPYLAELDIRLQEEPTSIIIVAGPRQCGKTTLVKQALKRSERPSSYLSADEPPKSVSEDINAASPLLYPERDVPWLVHEWESARNKAKHSERGFILVLDEAHRIRGDWSKAVKGLWDRDRWEGTPLHVVLLGSAPWLMQKGQSESLMGRFETIHLPHWSFQEMKQAFHFTLDQYIYFGGYPHGALLINNEARWRNYIRDSLVQPVMKRDVLALQQVNKPALLQQLFAYACEYSGQVLSYNKMLGPLQDAGNTVTLAHYLELLSNVELVRGLQKYAHGTVAQRRSSPKFTVFNTALISAFSGYSFAEAKADRSHWGRLVESAVGAHLCNSASSDIAVHYWREESMEVDFVVKLGRRLVAVEVKSGHRQRATPGLDEFARKYEPTCRVVIGTGGMSLEDFLSSPVHSLFGVP